MQFVKTADLKPGMRLAKPIYNKMGVLLYERDTKLTVQGINSVENFGLIGIFILEPAEPVPPLTQEDLEFEQFQTVYMFKLKDYMDKLHDGKDVNSLRDLTKHIYLRYGTLDHKLNFTQNLRSSADFVYKHSISVATLAAMIANELKLHVEDEQSLISAALLYDFGYLYVPQSILDKGSDLEPGDRDFIQKNLERGYEVMNSKFSSLELSAITINVIQNIIFKENTNYHLKETSASIQLLIDIINVADIFDRLTAMNINKPPLSEFVTINYLRAYPDKYNPNVVSALANCIHILPTGACLDLANGEKGLVLQENPADFLHPMVLNFSNNQIYDLSSPNVGNEFQILDIMKTMDNRIQIDESTLEQFSADESIRATAERFREKKIKLLKARQQREQETPAKRIKLQ